MYRHFILPKLRDLMIVYMIIVRTILPIWLIFICVQCLYQLYVQHINSVYTGLYFEITFLNCIPTVLIDDLLSFP